MIKGKTVRQRGQKQDTKRMNYRLFIHQKKLQEKHLYNVFKHKHYTDVYSNKIVYRYLLETCKKIEIRGEDQTENF